MDPLTISLTDLVLEKTQIHEINEKDIKDLITLFAACEVSDQEGRGQTNSSDIGSILANDLGFLVRRLLDKVAHFAKKYREEDKLDDQLFQTVLARRPSTRRRKQGRHNQEVVERC